MQISDAPWDDDASQGGIPMGAAMPLRTRARELIQAHPSIQQHRVPMSPRSRLSPPCQDRASSTPSAGTAGCQVVVAMPCGVPVTCRCLLGQTPLGTCLLRGGQLRICPVPASTIPSLTPGLPATTGTHAVAQGKALPLGPPVFLGVIQHLFNSARGTTRGVTAVPGVGREGERRERGREPSARAHPGAAVSVVGPCRGGHSWCWGRRKAKSQN